MKYLHLCSLASGLVLFLSAANAQTATWTGNALTTVQNWTDGANWDTGVAPNSPTVVAVINNTAVASSIPNGGVRIDSTTIDLAELWLGTSVASGPGTWAQRVVVTGPDFPTIGGTLNLRGAGITTANSPGANPLYYVGIGIDSHLNFYNGAGISGSNVVIGVDYSGFGFVGSVDFHDQSSAGSASIILAQYASGSFGSVTFHDQSTAATATIWADTMTFADQSTAGSAHIHTHAFGSTVRFQDQASAGSASISLGQYGGVIFAGQSSAGHATVECRWDAGGVTVLDHADVSGLILGSGRDASGQINGSGGLNISGAAGNVTLGGLDGLVRVNLGANTLILGPSSVDQLLAGGIAGSGGLVLDTGRVVTVALSEGFGPGNTYTGPTTVRSGTLHLASGRVSATTVTSAAELTGTGTIAGDLVNQGSVRPATPQGAPLAVQGDFTQTATGSLTLQLNSPASFDRLAVGGTANLGGSLALSFPGSPVTIGSQRYALVAAGGRTGTFDSVTGIPANTAMLNYQIAYTARDVALEVSQQSFAAAALTPAARALGTHLDATLGSATGGYSNLLLKLNSYQQVSDVTAGLERLTPDRYSVLADDAFAAAAGRQDALERRLELSRAIPSTKAEVFFEGGAQRTTYEATGGLPAVSFNRNRALAGAAWQRSAWTFGGTITTERSPADLDPLGSHTSIRSVASGLFVQYASPRFFALAALGYSNDDYHLQRVTGLSDQPETVTAAPKGSNTNFALTVGRTLPAGDWSVTPSLGLLASRFQLDSFTETFASGSPGAELAVTDFSSHSLRSRTGVAVTRRSHQGAFLARLDLDWAHEFQADRGFAARFAGAPVGSAYAVPGRPAETEVLQANLSASLLVGRSTALYAAAGSSWGRNSRVSTDFSAGLRMNF